MQINDTYLSREDRYAIGIESLSGRYYASIPVSNGIVDYDEYYELTMSQFDQFLEDREAAIEFIEACRLRQHDDLLLQPPGNNRGIPV
jgi:hypothetical protein